MRWVGKGMLALGWAALMGCSPAPNTGVAVQANVVAANFDELRFGVFKSPSVDSFQPSPTIVDPDTEGRMREPFAAGKPQQIFYLPDDLANQQVVCDVVALSRGMVTARGDRILTVVDGAITPVDVFLSPNVTNNGPSDSPPPPSTDPGQVVSGEPIP